LPIYSRFFVPAEYGAYGYVSTVVGLVSAVLILGGDSAYARYFFAARTIEDRQRVTSTWIAFLAAWTFIVVLVILPFSGQLSRWSFGTPDRALLFVFALAAAPVALMNRMFGQVLRNEFRAGPYTALNIASVGLSVALAVAGVVLLRLGIVGIFVGAFAAECVLLPVRAWTARGLLIRKFSVRLLRQLLAFGVPLVPTSLAYWVFLTSDRIVLGRLSTLSELGLYTVAVTIVAVPSVAIAAVGQAWSPHAYAAYESDESAARRLVARMYTYLLAGFGILAVSVTAFAPEILAVLSTSAFSGAARAVAPLALAMVAQATTNVTALGISLRKRTVYLAALSWIAAGVNLGLNLALDSRFGMIGAAWATTAAYSTLTAAFLVVSQRLWPVPIDRRKVSIAIVATIVFTLGASLIPPTGLGPAVVLKSGYTVLFAAVLVGLGVADRHLIVAAAEAVRPHRD